MGGPHTRSARLHRLWLSVLMAALGACANVPMVLGQLPIIMNGAPPPLPIIVDRNPTGAPIIQNSKPSMLGAPIEPSAPVVAPQPPRVSQPMPAPPQPTPQPRPVPQQRAQAPAQPLPAWPPQPRPVPQPLPVKPAEPAPFFEIEVLPPDGPIEPAPKPRSIVAQPLPTAPQAPAPDFEIELLRDEHARFAGVVGIGPAPDPLWIGPEQIPDETPEENVPVVELAPVEPTARFLRPIADMPEDPPANGLRVSTAPTSSMQEPQHTTLPIWSPPRITAPPQRPTSQPMYSPQQPPHRTRVYEVITWPWRTLTGQSRD